MGKIYIMRCPVCGAYLEQEMKEQYKCPCCWSTVTVNRVYESPWGKTRYKEIEEDIRVGEVRNPSLHGGGSRSGKSRKKKPNRSVRFLGGYDT